MKRKWALLVYFFMLTYGYLQSKACTEIKSLFGRQNRLEDSSRYIQVNEQAKNPWYIQGTFMFMTNQSKSIGFSTVAQIGYSFNNNIRIGIEAGVIHVKQEEEFIFLPWTMQISYLAEIWKVPCFIQAGAGYNFVADMPGVEFKKYEGKTTGNIIGRFECGVDYPLENRFNIRAGLGYQFFRYQNRYRIDDYFQEIKNNRNNIILNMGVKYFF